LGEPQRAEIQKIFHSDALTILNVVWAPGMMVRSKKGSGGVLDLDQALTTFPSTSECRFVPDGKDGKTYHNHGFFVLPLSFSGEPGEKCVDFASLKGALVQMHDFPNKIT
jgi:hypothetical protein